MSTSIRILGVEDSDQDATLLILELKKGGFAPNYVRVETPEDFYFELEKGDYDIVISDYSMPGFSGIEALEMFKQFELNIPFILISGTVGEEVAVEAMRLGAQDYLMKDRLTRLTQVIKRELKEARFRRERQTVEKEFRQKEEQYRILFENATDLVFSSDIEGNITSINRAAEKITSYSCEELLTMKISDIIEPENMNYVMEMIAKNLSSDDSPVFEAVFIAKDSRKVYGEIGVSVLRENSMAIGIQGIVRDITDRKKAEAELEKSRVEWSRAMEFFQDAVGIVDGSGKIVRANKAFYEMMGIELFDTEELNIQSILRSVGVSSDCLLCNALNDGKDMVTIMEKGHPDNPAGRPAEFVVKTIHGGDGERMAALIGIHDLTSQREEEKERMRLAKVMEQSADMVVVTDVEGVIQYVNPAFEKLTGYSRAEAIGNPANILKSGHYSKNFYANLWKKILKGEVWQGKFRNRIKNGALVNMSATISPVLDFNGQIVSFVGILRDTTKEDMLERQVRQSQKMQALGVLAGGVAHEFNNVLTGIMTYTEMTQMELEENDIAIGFLDESMKGCWKAREIIRQILTFSRSDSHIKLAPAKISELVNDSLSFMRATFPKNIEKRLDIDPDAGLIMANATQITQVVLNLCANAEHAMRGARAVLTVKLSKKMVDEEMAATNVELKPGPYALLAISDSGRGMDSDTLERIFEPFYTTKPKDEGTGMGLSVVHGIVSAHNGSITVESEIGQGAVFSVYLPIVEHVGAKITEPAPGF